MTSQGFLKVPATFTRTGVFSYVDKDGKPRRELRHPDDVFAPESIESLKLAPLTFQHPKQFVTSENVRDLQTGYIGDGIDISSGKYVGGVVLVTDKKAIEKANSGTVELSCGYTADMIDETGNYEGMDYDCRQVNIRYNHVAQVPAGRAGPLVRMHLDADDAMEVEKPNREETRMKITISGKEFEVAPEVATYIQELKAGDETMDSKLKEKDVELKSKDEETKEAKKKADAAEALALETKKANDVLQAKLDSTELKLQERNDSAMTPDQVNQHVKARMKIEKVAAPVLGAEFKEDASDLDLMKAVITKRSPAIKLDGKSEDYVKACFDVIAEDSQKKKETHEHLNSRFSAPRQDADYDLKSAREKQSTAASEAWKQPLSASKR